MKKTSTFGPSQRGIEIGEILQLATEHPMALECGVEISDFPLAYQTYGTLNADKTNAILLCHALTADQYAAGTHPVTGKTGWWEHFIGPGCVLDTDRYFVICANVLGGCMGSYGPKTTNPVTSMPTALDLPVVTIGDMVRAQVLLIDALGIDKLLCVIGGSMGGMQVLEWAARYPERMHAAVPIATSVRQSAQNIAFHEIGRQAIMADPDWCKGNYGAEGHFPTKGLAVARMAAHVTYLSENALQHKFGRDLQDRDAFTYGFEADFKIESYLRHQGMTFVERFDANSYLYLTRAASYYDLTQGGATKLATLFAGSDIRYCVISFSSDWLFPTKESRQLVHALNAVAAGVSFTEIESDKGHDAFLLPDKNYEAVLRGFINGCAERIML